MGLILPPPSWTNYVTNDTGTISATFGTVMTSGSANADGSTVSVISALSFDVHLLVISFNRSNGAGVNTSGLCDIMIDPAGGTSWATDPLIPDLMAGSMFIPGSAGNVSSMGHCRVYHFPIYVKAGASIGARWRCATTTRAASIVIHALGSSVHPCAWWTGSSVSAIGTDAATSQGTSHTAGNSGAYSTWTNIGSTLSRPAGCLTWTVGCWTQTLITGGLIYYFQFGVNSTAIGPPLALAVGSNETVTAAPLGIVPVNLPTGTQLQVRATCSGTAQTMDVAAWATH